MSEKFVLVQNSEQPSIALVVSYKVYMDCTTGARDAYKEMSAKICDKCTTADLRSLAIAKLNEDYSELTKLLKSSKTILVTQSQRNGTPLTGSKPQKFKVSLV